MSAADPAQRGLRIVASELVRHSHEVSPFVLSTREIIAGRRHPCDEDVSCDKLLAHARVIDSVEKIVRKLRPGNSTRANADAGAQRGERHAAEAQRIRDRHPTLRIVS